MANKRQRFAGTIKAGEKGQIVVPKEIRDLFGIKAGDRLLVLADISSSGTRNALAISRLAAKDLDKVSVSS